MNKYSQHGRCGKCNFDTVSTQFVAKGVWAMLGNGKGQKRFEIDVMLRKCKRCGWTWVEAPFDEKVEEDQEDDKCEKLLRHEK